MLVRTVKDGRPVYFTVALPDVDAYGNATAENLKRAIDEVLTNKVIIPAERYIKLCQQQQMGLL